MSYGLEDTDVGTRCSAVEDICIVLCSDHLWGRSRPSSLLCDYNLRCRTGCTSFFFSKLCVYLWIEYFSFRYGYKGFFYVTFLLKPFPVVNEKLTMSQFLFSLYLMCTKPLSTCLTRHSGEKAPHTKIGRSDTSSVRCSALTENSETF